MKSIADINAIREQMRSKVLIRDNAKEGETHVFVGMGTCGIEKGAVAVFNAFEDEISSRCIKNVRISRTGCLGSCEFEPIVEVALPGKAPVRYGNVDADKAKEIIEKHVIGGEPVAAFIVK